MMSPLPRRTSQSLADFLGSFNEQGSGMDVVSQEAAEEFFRMMQELEMLRDTDQRNKKEIMRLEEKLDLYNQATVDLQEKYNSILEECNFLQEEVDKFELEREGLQVRIRKQTVEIQHLKQEADEVTRKMSHQSESQGNTFDSYDTLGGYVRPKPKSQKSIAIDSMQELQL